MHNVTITDANASNNRDEWLDLRRQHVTATDWPKITGTSRWGDTRHVIYDKLDSEFSSDFVPSLPMKVGTALEPLIVSKAKRILGRGEYLSQAFISRKRLGFTPDLILIKKSSDWVLAEIKVHVKEWGGIVPPDYLDQVRFQATVLGVDQVHVIHLKLSSWGEGLRMMNSGEVPSKQLEVLQVDINETERKQIERNALRWWKDNIVCG